MFGWFCSEAGSRYFSLSVTYFRFDRAKLKGLIRRFYWKYLKAYKPGFSDYFFGRPLDGLYWAVHAELFYGLISGTSLFDTNSLLPAGHKTSAYGGSRFVAELTQIVGSSAVSSFCASQRPYSWVSPVLVKGQKNH